MKQVCVLVFVPVGVRECIRVCVDLFTFLFLLVSCAVCFSVCMDVRVCAVLLTDSHPHVWLVSPYHTQQYVPTTVFYPAEMFPHFYHPSLVSMNQATDFLLKQ